MSKMTEQNKAEAYKMTLVDLKYLTQKRQSVMWAFVSGSAYYTRRELSKKVGLEISTLCGIIDALMKKGWLREAFSAQCETTGKMVVVYTPTQEAGVIYEDAGFQHLRSNFDV